MISWQWVKTRGPFRHPCATRYIDEGFPRSIMCSYAHKRREDFTQEAAKAGWFSARVPNTWTCIPFVLHVVEDKIVDATMNNRDVLSMLVRRRRVSRTKKVRHEEIRFFEQIPMTLEAIDELENMGFQCFHFAITHEWIRYWYEHPQNRWVVMIEWDGKRGQMADFFCTDDREVALRKLNEKECEQ